MKKILLIALIFGASFLGRSQEIVFNEIYPDPNAPNDESFELYNTTANFVDLDCYTVIFYYKENGGGAWVFNLPDIQIAPFGHVVFGSAIPIQHKFGGNYSGANAYNWNDLVFLAANGGSLTNYTRVGNNLVINPALTTTLDLIPISNGNDAAVAAMLWKGTGVLSNALFTNSDIPQGSSAVVSLNPLTVPVLEDELDGDDCPVTAELVFSTISQPAVEVAAITQAPGTNNGYFRTRDGFCGVWDKSQNEGEFTPGQKNSSLPPLDFSASIDITIAPEACGNPNTNWNISVTVDNPILWPALFRVYQDNNNSQKLDLGDVQVGPDYDVTDAVPVVVEDVPIKTGHNIIVQLVTASGCVQVEEFRITGCFSLPVTFSSFTATRASSNVLVKWETASEKNSAGFAVERNVMGTWEQVGFVNSQAIAGTSDTRLVYSFVDINNLKGITQYRIRQVDMDAKSSYSEIRSVRGNGVSLSTVVYPNPTNDGKVNITFSEGNAVRNVSIMDMSGRIIKQINGITNNNITVENLNPGVYTVRVTVPETGEQGVQKIIVNKR